VRQRQCSFLGKIGISLFGSGPGARPPKRLILDRNILLWTLRSEFLDAGVMG
jgi:hypothetical protein